MATVSLNLKKNLKWACRCWHYWGQCTCMCSYICRKTLAHAKFHPARGEPWILLVEWKQQQRLNKEKRMRSRLSFILQNYLLCSFCFLELVGMFCHCKSNLHKKTIAVQQTEQGTALVTAYFFCHQILTECYLWPLSKGCFFGRLGTVT